MPAFGRWRRINFNYLATVRLTGRHEILFQRIVCIQIKCRWPWEAPGACICCMWGINGSSSMQNMGVSSKKWTINFGFVSAFVCSFVWSLLFCFGIWDCLAIYPRLKKRILPTQFPMFWDYRCVLPRSLNINFSNSTAISHLEIHAGELKRTSQTDILLWPFITTHKPKQKVNNAYQQMNR